VHGKIAAIAKRGCDDGDLIGESEESDSMPVG
jgi:hypothetical protein